MAAPRGNVDGRPGPEPASGWRGWLSERHGLIVVLLLLVLLTVMRAVGQLGPQGLSWLVPLGFLLMLASPFVLLSGAGRRRIGFKRPGSASSYLWGAALGAVAAGACFLLGLALFGHGAENWFVTVAEKYRSSFDTSGLTVLMLHVIFTLPALIFSPLGEESFFRGLLQGGLEERAGVNVSAVIQSLAFGLVHLLHHGLVVTAAGLTVLPLSGAIWVLLMLGTALLFTVVSRRSGSLYPAIVSHAVFNLTMNSLIFAWIW